MTKYCNSFLKSQKCLNTECLYQHYKADKKYISKKQDNQSIKKYINIDLIELEEKFIKKHKNFILKKSQQIKVSKKKTVFPSCPKILKSYIDNYSLDHSVSE